VQGDQGPSAAGNHRLGLMGAQATVRQFHQLAKDARCGTITGTEMDRTRLGVSLEFQLKASSYWHGREMGAQDDDATKTAQD